MQKYSVLEPFLIVFEHFSGLLISHFGQTLQKIFFADADVFDFAFITILSINSLSDHNRRKRRHLFRQNLNLQLLTLRADAFVVKSAGH